MLLTQVPFLLNSYKADDLLVGIQGVAIPWSGLLLPPSLMIKSIDMISPVFLALLPSHRHVGPHRSTWDVHKLSP